MSNVLRNGAIFSTFKHTGLLTVRGRSTLKDGEVNGVYSNTGSYSNPELHHIILEAVV